MTHDARELSTYTGEPHECIRFWLGSQTWRLTSSDVPVGINEGGGADEQYHPVPIERTEIERSDEESNGTMKVTLPRWHEVAALFIPYNPTTPVGVMLYQKHEGETESVVGFNGAVVSAEFGESQVTLTCMTLGGLLRRRLPRWSYQSQCNHALYGVRCGVNRDDFKETAVLHTIGTLTIKATDFAAHPAGWFTNGYVENTYGEKRFITDHVGDTLTLMSPFFNVAIGDTVYAYAGCQRTESECFNKFNNLVNHLGFSRIPQRNPHEKGIG